MSAQDQQRLDELIHRALDGIIQPDESLELQCTLKDSATARQYFHQIVDLHTELEWMLNSEVIDIPLGITPPAPAPKADTSTPWATASGWLAFAASIVLAVILYLNNTSTKPRTAESIESATELPYIARTNYSADASLNPLSSIKKADTWITAGTIILDEGTLGLTFDTGTQLVIEAPSTFEIESPSRATLHSGNAVAKVPEPAIGFTIHTPNSSVVDLGTEFAVQVNGEVSTVKVLDGEVQAYANNQQGEIEDLILSSNESVTIAPSTPSTFTQIASFEAPRFHDWNLFYQPQSDWIHFDFENDGLYCKASGSWGANAHAVFKSAHQHADSPATIPGVFGSALKFDGRGSYIQTNLDGVTGDHPRSVAFWVKIPPGQPEDAVAIVAWGQPNKGKRWQIGINHKRGYGTLGAIRTDFSHGFVTGSTDLRDGKWHHVASVYIGGYSKDVASHIRHYVDGKLESVSQHRLNNKGIRTVTDENSTDDNIMIGFRQNSTHNTIPPMKASIDELYIFDQAILPSQIQSLIDSNTR